MNNQVEIAAGTTVQYRKVGKATVLSLNSSLQGDGSGWYNVQFITGPKRYREDVQVCWIGPRNVI